MKHKAVKKWMALGLTTALALGMTACASANDKMAMTGNSGYLEEKWNDLEAWSTADGDYIEEKPETDATLSGQEVIEASETRKTIKTAKLTLQTLDFSTFVSALEQKVKEAGAYFQYADVTTSYSGRKYASYTVRVPEENLEEFLKGIDGIATVTNKVLGEQDVTLSYVDTQSRIKALETEQETLLSLLEKADSLDSVILLQERLTEVRYELESYKTKLRTYDDKISYSTVSITVNEVQKVTEPQPKTVLERIQSGFGNTVETIIESAQDVFVWVAVNIPYLVFWGLIATFAVFFTKKKSKKRKQRKLEKQHAENGTEMGSKE